MMGNSPEGNESAAPPAQPTVPRDDPASASPWMGQGGIDLPPGVVRAPSPAAFRAPQVRRVQQRFRDGRRGAGNACARIPVLRHQQRVARGRAEIFRTEMRSTPSNVRRPRHANRPAQDLLDVARDLPRFKGTDRHPRIQQHHSVSVLAIRQARRRTGIPWISRDLHLDPGSVARRRLQLGPLPRSIWKGKCPGSSVRIAAERHRRFHVQPGGLSP